MGTKIILPAGGQTTDESLVTYWYKKVGDAVRLGEPLFSVETDKATMDVESCAEGTLLAVYHNADETVKAGELMAFVGKAGEALPGAPAPGPQQPAVQAAHSATYTEAQAMRAEAKASPDNNGPLRASPAARKLAKENGIALADMAAAQPIKRRDVQAALAARRPSVEEEFTLLDLSPSRKAIAGRMTRSVAEAPQFHISVEVDMEKAIALRETLNRSLAEGFTEPARVSFNDIVMKCACRAIVKYPKINSCMHEGRIKLWKAAHFGLAVGLEDGLAVPVARNADTMPLGELARINSENVQKAREGRLRQEDISGGTVTLTNLGMYGVSAFSAILNPPEACILALGAIMEKPVVWQGALVVGHVMTVTATFDHRIVDGAYGAAFLRELKYLLENVELLLL